VWATAALALHPPHLAAQLLNFRNYGPHDGLPQAQAMALHQDRQGFLWVGTYGGLSRYDGRTFQTLTSRDGLTVNRVTDLAETDDGTLVVGTHGGGVCFVADRVVVECLGKADGLAGDVVKDLFADDYGSVWVATTTGLTELRDRRPVRTFRTAEGLPSNDVSGVFLLDVLSVLTAAGVAELRRDRFEGSPQLTGRDLALVLPTAGGTFVAGPDGLVLHRDGHAESVPIPPTSGDPSFTDAVADRSGRAWFATRSGVLIYEDGKVRRITTANGLPSDRVERVLVGREGIVWFGTEAGLSKLVPGPFVLLAQESGLPPGTARALAMDRGGQVWVGTRNGAVAWEGERFRALPLPPEITDPRVYSLAAAPEGGMLVGARSGLVHYRDDGTTRVYTVRDGLPSDYVSALLPDEGTVWIGTGAGMARWEGGVIDTLDIPELRRAHVTDLAFDAGGRLWVALGTEGVRVWDGRTVRSLGREAGLTDQWIWDLAPDALGRMWIGSNGDGAFVVEGDTIRQITMRDGLANDFVWSILPDSRGDVWFFSSYGLDRYTNGAFRHYGPGAGVVDIEGSATAALEDETGVLWFGSSGVYRYDPALDVPDQAPPPIYAEGPSIGARRYPRIDAALPPRPGLVTMHFSSPSFRDERSVRFRYRLAGEGDAWSEPVAEGTVSLAGLGPGSYTFEVIAVSPDGVESAVPARVRFAVRPTFWQTTWFLGLAALLAMGAVAGVPALRARRLERERKRLEGLVREHTHELQLREERIRAIVEHSTNLFYAHGADHRLTYVSPQAWTFFDCSPEDALKNWTDFLTDDPGNAAGVETTERAIRTGERQPPYELELRSATGRKLRVLVNEAPVVVGGRTVSIVGSLTDITEAREAEEQRRRMEEQFLQAQRMEAVGRLAGGVAHDFNNLLTSILGHAQLLGEAAAPGSDILEDLAEIEKAAKRGSSLVSHLLGFSRRQIRRDERMDAREALADLRELLLRLTTVRIELDLCTGDQPLHVHFDRAQLGQVIANLAINAVDAMPNGGRLTVAARSVDLPKALVRAGPDQVPAGRYVSIEVADTGSGMDAAVLEHVFEPFFTTKERGTASGLGLSMVYGAVRQGGGYVTAASTPDVGTVVRILLLPAD
jgi:PAS domain S-box-containing protein